MAKEEKNALVYVDDKVTVTTVTNTVEEKTPHPLAEGLHDFLQRVDDIYLAVATMHPAAVDILGRKIRGIRKTIEDAEQKIRSGSPAQASFAGARIVEVSHDSERLSRSRLPEVVERGLFVSLFSEYDYFSGLLLKELYRRRPDLLFSLSKQISFGDLLKFGDIESVKRAVLESEIDSIRRESYAEQFAILQRKFGLQLTKFPEWPSFIEASQRRNLMVHCGGYVSDQYLQVCEAAGYKFVTRPAVGERLDIGADYFNRAAGVVARVAFMLTHTLWQKVLPSEANEAHDCLNDQIYRFLCAKRWKMAADMGAFSLSEPMLAHATDMQHRIRLCNTAIALKNLKKQDEMKALLASVDWTASIRDFRLAVAILDDKLEDAAMLMRQIGKRGELVHEIAYHQWPLFGTFRETQVFHKAYEDVYGYPFYVRAERSAEEAMSLLDKKADRSEIEEPRKRRSAKRKRTSKRARQANPANE